MTWCCTGRKEMSPWTRMTEYLSPSSWSRNFTPPQSWLFTAAQVLLHHTLFCFIAELKLQKISFHLSCSIPYKGIKFFMHELIISIANIEGEYKSLAEKWNRQAVVSLLCAAGNPLKALHCSNNHLSLSSNSKHKEDFVCYLPLPELLGQCF